MAEKSAKKQKTDKTEEKEPEKAPPSSTPAGESKKADDKTEEQTGGTEEEDISTPCWFYQDSNGLKQGPFSFKEMFLWWKGGYFANDLPVKTVWETEFTPLATLPQFYNVPVKLAERIEKEQEELITKGQIEVPVYEPPKEEATTSDQYDEYTVVGGFNPLSGKFQKDDSASYFGSKGLPVDRDQRMMSHYFDYQQYQLQMQAAGDKKKKKLVKGTKKFWKERKEKKKRAKLLAEYLAD